jgi:hypothetical protein
MAIRGAPGKERFKMRRGMLVTLIGFLVLLFAMTQFVYSQESGTASESKKTAIKSPIAKGSLELSGGFSLSTYNGDLYEYRDQGVTVIEFNPSIAKFVSNGFQIGGLMDYYHYQEKGYSRSYLTLGLLANYYFNVNKEKSGKGVSYPYLGAAFKSFSSKINHDEDKYTLRTFSLYGGDAVFLSNAVAFYGQLEMDFDSVKPEGEESVSGTVFKIFTGFKYFIF